MDSPPGFPVPPPPPPVPGLAPPAPPPPPPPTFVPDPQEMLLQDLEGQGTINVVVEGSSDEAMAEGIAGFMLSAMTASEKKPKTRTPRVAKEKVDDTGGEETVSPGGRKVQAKRSSRIVDEDRLYDGTQLHAGHHGYFVHRDYAAHFFRWGFAARAVKPGMRVLDVGSGQDLALPRVLSAPNVYPNSKPAAVVCVDWNPITTKFNPAWLTAVGEFDFNTRWPELVGSFLQDGQRYVDLPDSHFDLVTCFEVIEHQDEKQGDELLGGLKACLKPGGRILLSTPVFDGKAAANHIHEYGIMELWQKIVNNGLVVMERYGTYASLDVIKPHLTEQERQLAEELGRWYSNDVLSCFLAPKYPDLSRNNAWVLMRAEDIQQVQQ